jgi:hypothetical protein
MPRENIANVTSRTVARIENPFPDEVAEVLLALHELEKRVSSPIIRLCLEEARCDIAHLVGVGTGFGVEGNGCVEDEGEQFPLASR